MFETTKENFYKSLAASIRERQMALKLENYEILDNEIRMSRITKNIRNKYVPYLIAKNEYPYLNHLFVSDSRETFLSTPITEPENYDDMLWGHIDWDAMFDDFIRDLLSLDVSGTLGELFEDALVDYVPYVRCRFEGCITAKSRRDAARYEYQKCGSTQFGEAFYTAFGGMLLSDFDENFNAFAMGYVLHQNIRSKRQPKLSRTSSFGHQAEAVYNAVSEHRTKMGEIIKKNPEKEASIRKWMESYERNALEWIKTLEKLQKRFDRLLS